MSQQVTDTFTECASIMLPSDPSKVSAGSHSAVLAKLVLALKKIAGADETKMLAKVKNEQLDYEGKPGGVKRESTGAASAAPAKKPRP